jgi:hypothetical protein
MELIVRISKKSLRFLHIYFVIALILQACGGSDQNDPQTDDNTTDQNRSILKVSDVHTLADLKTPVSLYNNTGDGIAIWTVSGFGHSDSSFGGAWLYYSLYDNASKNWSQAQRLADVDGYGLSLRLVTNGKGFAALWSDSDDYLHVSVFDGSEWTATHGASDENTRIIQQQFTSNTGSIGGYKIVSNKSGYGITWEESESLHVSLFDGSDWTTTQLAEASNPDAKLTSNGEGYLIVWHQPQTDELYASASQDGTTWDEAVLLNQSPLENGYFKVVSNGSGYLVLWKDEDYLVQGILHNGSSWHDHEALISANNDTGEIHYASNGQGYSLVWDEGATILSRTYTTSGGWNQIGEIFSHNNGDPADFSPTSVIDLISNGSGYCVLFYAYENPGWANYAAVNSLGDENWGTATLLSQYEDRLNHSESLVSDGESYAVAWKYYNGPFTIGEYPEEYTTDYYASVYQDATWNTTNEPINVINGSTSFDVVGHNGDYLITLNKTIDGVERLSATLYDNTNGWNESQTLEGDFGLTPTPSITVNPSSGISLLWHQFNDSGTDISTFSNQWDGDQWLGQSLACEGDYLLGSSRAPQLIATDNGQTLAIWSQYSAGRMTLFGNIRSSVGWSQPIAFTYSLSPVKPPQIATNGTGFAVAWQELNDDLYTTKAIAFQVEEWDESLIGRVKEFAQNTVSATLTSNGRDYMLLYGTIESLSSTFLVAHRYNGTDWLEEPMVLTEDSKSLATYPQITSNGETYLAAWFEQGDTYTEIDLVTSEFDGEAWDHNQRITSVLDVTKVMNTRWSDFPQLASNGEDYAVFWIDDDKIKCSFYTDSWSTTEEVGNISFASGVGWGDRETLSVVSNGEGYAIAWHSSEISSQSAVFANIYDGSSWSGATNLSMSTTSTVMFEMVNNSRLIKSSGDKYAILWGHRVEEFSNDADAVYVKVFDGSEWSTTTRLSSIPSINIKFQLASDGTGGFLAAWLAGNDSGDLEILTKTFNGNDWEDSESVVENDFRKYDLSLLDGVNGYQAIWTQAEPGGDPQVRIPWAMSGL